jgi:hypothetical protein
MKTTPKLAAIARALRNRTSKAATLARWHRLRPAAQLANLRSLPSYAGETLAERRAYRLRVYHSGPELSAPDAETPILWTNTDSPEILDAYPGREFLKHRGWHTDDDERETIEAYAAILADFPGLIFEAVRESCSGGIRVDLSTASAIDYSEADSDYNASEAREDAARETVRAADSTAERDAERERDYQDTEWHRASLEEARADLADNRAKFRRLRCELRKLCTPAMREIYPAAADAIRAQVKAILRRRTETLDTIAEHKQALS